MLCDHLEDGGLGQGGRREARQEGDICILSLIHAVVRQKPIQHGKAIILQLKINKRYMYPNVHCSSIYNRQDTEAT